MATNNQTDRRLSFDFALPSESERRELIDWLIEQGKKLDRYASMVVQHRDGEEFDTHATVRAALRTWDKFREQPNEADWWKRTAKFREAVTNPVRCHFGDAADQQASEAMQASDPKPGQRKRKAS